MLWFQQNQTGIDPSLTRLPARYNFAPQAQCNKTTASCGEISSLGRTDLLYTNVETRKKKLSVSQLLAN